jgi:hypothetical protein
VLRALGYVALLFIAGELLARFAVGLGDPPLFIADDKIEYLNKPGTYRRFGHPIHINQWSMRSPDFADKKPNSDELRVLVLGDSVVYGGAWMRDEETATSKLATKLEQASGRPVVVANVAAGSWGPPNQLAYLRRFGDFDADAIIVVWNSHDAWDVPTFAPLGLENPTATPPSALVELITRYGLPRLTRGTAIPALNTTERADESLRAARSILEFARSNRIPIAVVLHRTRPELNQGAVEGLDLFGQVAESEDAPVFMTSTVLRTPFGQGKDVYKDDIHPSPGGQSLMADLYFRIALELLSGPVPAR